MTVRNVTVINYGSGNLLSVSRALHRVGAKVTLSSDPRQVEHSDFIVLPGVGAFKQAMSELERLALIDPIRLAVRKGCQFLGICLGMQLLFDASEEFGESSGLELLSGRVIRLPSVSTNGDGMRIPHIGWNSLYAKTGGHSSINKIISLNDEISVYFVHSFMVQPSNHDDIVAWCLYGGHEIPAIVSRNNIHGCQFHPEKSGSHGLQILSHFLTL